MTTLIEISGAKRLQATGTFQLPVILNNQNKLRYFRKHTPITLFYMQTAVRSLRAIYTQTKRDVYYYFYFCRSNYPLQLFLLLNKSTLNVLQIDDHQWCMCFICWCYTQYVHLHSHNVEC